MAWVCSIDDATFDRSVFDGASCAFGVFDGVHRGHRFLLERTLESARRSGGQALVVTFDIDPDELFHPDRLKKLLANEDRIAELSSSGVYCVFVLRSVRPDRVS